MAQQENTNIVSPGSNALKGSQRPDYEIHLKDLVVGRYYRLKDKIKSKKLFGSIYGIGNSSKDNRVLSFIYSKPHKLIEKDNLYHEGIDPLAKDSIVLEFKKEYAYKDFYGDLVMISHDLPDGLMTMFIDEKKYNETMKTGAQSAGKRKSRKIRRHMKRKLTRRQK